MAIGSLYNKLSPFQRVILALILGILAGLFVALDMSFPPRQTAGQAWVPQKRCVLNYLLAADDHAAYAIEICRGDIGNLTKIALTLAVSTSHEVRRKRLVSLDLAGLGQLYALGDALLGLLLGHGSLYWGRES